MATRARRTRDLVRPFDAELPAWAVRVLGVGAMLLGVGVPVVAVVEEWGVGEPAEVPATGEVESIRPRLIGPFGGTFMMASSGDAASVLAVVFSPDGTRIATASWDQTARLWDAASGELLHTLAGHSGSVYEVAFSPDGTHIATASGDHTARLWDAASGELLLTLEGHSGPLYAVAFSPDGTRIATAGDDHTVRLWSPASGQYTFTLDAHSGAVKAIAFSPDDGKHLATASNDKTVKLWDVADKSVLYTFGHRGPVSALAFSPDGESLATASFNSGVKLWSTHDGVLRSTLDEFSDSLALAFSPDGKSLATTSADDTIKLWDTASGELLRTIGAHSMAVTAVDFSPDGKSLATASADNSAKLWDAATGKLLLTLDARPRHEVTLSPFAMCETEVSLRQYEFVTGERPSDCDYGCDDDDPVRNVSWQDAVRYLNELTRLENRARTQAGMEWLTVCYDESTWVWDRTCTGYRLPTEAEWEYAARAGSKTAYSFGEDPRDICNYGHVQECRGPFQMGVVGVETKSANRWGLKGMHGNVREWVFDVWDEKTDYQSPTTDPVNEEGDPLRRVLRSGAFNSSAEFATSEFRQWFEANEAGWTVGIRCAMGWRPTK